MYLVTANEMQQIDRETIDTFGIPGMVLMENAGRGATRFLLESFPDIAGKKVAVMAGRGNNGGDGFVMARYLSQRGIRVVVCVLASKDKVGGDAGANLRLLQPLGVPLIEIPDIDAFSKQQTFLRHQDIWIDAILGTGLKSDVKDFLSRVISFINQLNKPVFAVDIPSGLNSETGQPCGICIKAHATATFAFPKIGHMVYPGAHFTGQLRVVDIGIPNSTVAQIAPRQSLITGAQVAGILPARSPETHKGDTGHVLVIAGSPGKTGAAVMTAVSAVRSGAGLVTLATPASLNPVLEAQVLEVMTHPLPEQGFQGLLDESAYETIMDLLSRKSCLAIGPGIGTAPGTRRLVHKIIESCPLPIVIDADGLNCLAGETQVLCGRKIPVVLTPHPGEMARLISATPKAIQQDRITHARNFAEQFDVHLVLKGARTVVAHPDGSVDINPTGNPGMASGGMGDVLTGIIAGLIAQGCPPAAAARAGVFVHGAAADTLAQELSPQGFIASEVMHLIPRIMQRLVPADVHARMQAPEEPPAVPRVIF